MRQDTRDKSQETRDTRQETRNKRQETRDKRNEDNQKLVDCFMELRNHSNYLRAQRVFFHEKKPFSNFNTTYQQTYRLTYRPRDGQTHSHHLCIRESCFIFMSKNLLRTTFNHQSIKLTDSWINGLTYGWNYSIYLCILRS